MVWKKTKKVFMKTMLIRFLKAERSRMEKGPDTFLNLLNTGIIVDLKKAKSNAIKIMEKWIK